LNRAPQAPEEELDVLNAPMQAVLDGDLEQVTELTVKGVSQGLLAQQILDEALTPAMDVVGWEYENGDRYILEMLIPAEAVKDPAASYGVLYYPSVRGSWNRLLDCCCRSP